ncbi:MAG: PQQ-dependent sugar dehydrogenase [Adhaeribacter sp.]
MRSAYFFLSFLAFLTACTSPARQGAASRRPAAYILLYSPETGAALEQSLQQATDKPGWRLTRASQPVYLLDDSLRQFSSIVIPFSVLNTLDHRALTGLKRYAEAGGGGLVAIKDTLLQQQGWPWLQAWNELQPGTASRQDQAPLHILAPGPDSKALQKALQQAVGANAWPDFRQATSLAVPEASRYTYQVLSQGMDEPMQMAILPNYNVLIAERKGSVKLYDASTRQTKIIANLAVFSGIEDGLLGVAADPGFEKNNWVYFYYAVAGNKAVNRLTRMELKGEQLVRTSEKVLLEIPMQRQYCCHSAGYLVFDRQGLLYLSVGDNTNAEETEGYIPIDERPGRELADDQATAANTNDLRGKILRIKPEPDGTYSIPAGNLFAPGTPKTRPEIYTMGHRNPYRFSVDAKNGFLYTGDVGPDTKVPASSGTLSFDEINQVRHPGFFGWPYFLGRNEAFPYYSFSTKKEGPKFNPVKPLNNSPNNTGLRELPPAQPAMIWYGDGQSKEFPLLGKGGESAMAGPVYYADQYAGARFKMSPYYDGKLFIYDWVRRWFMAVTFDQDLHYLRMEPFLDHLPFAAPTDMQIAPDGAIYILEYGTNWFAKNMDARLVRIEYAEGNRKPVANIHVNSLHGAAPFQARLSASNSRDYDKGDQLSFTWQVEGKQIPGENISYTFAKPGTYPVSLTVADNHGEQATSTVEIKVGNEPPTVQIQTKANQSFYWDQAKLDYQVQVADREDKTIDPKAVQVSFTFLPQGKDIAVALSNPPGAGSSQHIKGQYLVNSLDCKACHSLDKPSVGPSYQAVAQRYAGKPGVSEQLVQKIIKGGSGNWGGRTMSAHPDLAPADASQIVQYILSLSAAKASLPLQGTLPLKDHLGQGTAGSYLLMAHYTDKGANQIEPLAARSYLTLRNPLVQIEDFDEGNIRLGTITTEALTYGTNVRHRSYVRFNQVDLSHLESVRYRVLPAAGGQIEMRLGRPDGPLISTLAIGSGTTTDLKKDWKEMSAPLQPTRGKHDLFLVFTNEKETQRNLFMIDWMYFTKPKP